ncbi:hypothetical protein B0H14DRAFT_2604498 [Mycena olivaceomarginata]|nr:hypothetical protein B0H14DRAFT_2604498 [Mycena olivaceomarginata]
MSKAVRVHKDKLKPSKTRWTFLPLCCLTIQNHTKHIICFYTPAISWSKVLSLLASHYLTAGRRHKLQASMLSPSTNGTTVSIGKLEMLGGHGGDGGRGPLGTGGEGGIGHGAALFSQSASGSSRIVNVVCCCKLLTKHSSDSALHNIDASGPPLLTQHQSLLKRDRFLAIIEDIQTRMRDAHPALRDLASHIVPDFQGTQTDRRYTSSLRSALAKENSGRGCDASPKVRKKLQMVVHPKIPVDLRRSAHSWLWY